MIYGKLRVFFPGVEMSFYLISRPDAAKGFPCRSGKILISSVHRKQGS